MPSKIQLTIEVLVMFFKTTLRKNSGSPFFALGFILYSQKINKSICFVKLTGYRKKGLLTVMTK